MLDAKRLSHRAERLRAGLDLLHGRPTLRVTAIIAGGRLATADAAANALGHTARLFDGQRAGPLSDAFLVLPRRLGGGRLRNELAKRDERLAAAVLLADDQPQPPVLRAARHHFYTQAGAGRVSLIISRLARLQAGH